MNTEQLESPSATQAIVNALMAESAKRKHKPVTDIKDIPIDYLANWLSRKTGLEEYAQLDSMSQQIFELYGRRRFLRASRAKRAEFDTVLSGFTIDEVANWTYQRFTSWNTCAVGEASGTWRFVGKQLHDDIPFKKRDKGMRRIRLSKAFREANSLGVSAYHIADRARHMLRRSS